MKKWISTTAAALVLSFSLVAFVPAIYASSADDVADTSVITTDTPVVTEPTTPVTEVPVIIGSGGIQTTNGWTWWW